MKRGLILTGGDLVDNFADYTDLKFDYVIACDSGIKQAMSVNINVDLALGDFDSIERDDITYLKDKGIKTLIYPSEKDATDTELACYKLIEMKCDEIVFVGGIGSRLDHSIANTLLLSRLKKYGIKSKIISNNNIIMYLSAREKIIVYKVFKYLSIIPVDRSGMVISSVGLKYELKDMLIPFSSSLGVSNEILNISAKLEAKSGAGLIILSKDK